MALYDATQPRLESAIVFGRIGRVMANTYADFLSWNDRRVTRKALQALSDHELSDIGLHRGDIDAI